MAPVLRFCEQCGRLYADLVALSTALSLAALPGRPRDYTLGPSDAERLRSSGWRTWWSAIGSARDRVTRPLAIGFSTLGLASLLLTAAPSLVPHVGSAAAPVQEDLRLGAATGSAALITASPARGDAESGPTGPALSMTPVVSVALIVAGGGLFAARRIAARQRQVR